MTDEHTCTGCGAKDVDVNDGERCIDCEHVSVEVGMETLCLAEEMIGATIDLALRGHMHPDDLRKLVEDRVAACGDRGLRTGLEIHEAHGRNLASREERKEARLAAARPQRGEEGRAVPDVIDTRKYLGERTCTACGATDIDINDEGECIHCERLFLEARRALSEQGLQTLRVVLDDVLTSAVSPDDVLALAKERAEARRAGTYRPPATLHELVVEIGHVDDRLYGDLEA